MKFRHEIKYYINVADFVVLKQRLSALLKKDEHSIDGHYNIRSLYFDNLYDKALLEKINGANIREKFRIRYYNDDTSFIRLEKKSKINGLCNKVSEKISKEEVSMLLDGNIDWMLSKERPLILELYAKMKNEGLKPKVIVDYDRIPFTYGPGNVRVTLDYNIRTGMDVGQFLDKDCVLLKAGEDARILEVKWDEYLPDIVKSAVNLNNRSENAFSKYVACRYYG